MSQEKTPSYHEKCNLFKTKYYNCLDKYLHNDLEDSHSCRWILKGWDTCKLLNKKNSEIYLKTLISSK